MNEQKTNELVEFLNGVFARMANGLVAKGDGAESVDVGRQYGIDYNLLLDEDGWNVGRMVCIAGDRETPDDYDIELLGFTNSNVEVARLILAEEAKVSAERAIENTMIELHGEDGVPF